MTPDKFCSILDVCSRATNTVSRKQVLLDGISACTVCLRDNTFFLYIKKKKNHQLHIWAARLTLLSCQSLRRCWRGDGFIALTTNPSRPAGPFTITDALTDNTGPKPDTEVYLVWVYQLSHCCLLITSSLELRRPPLKALPECNWINAQGVQHRETSSWHIAVQSSSEQPMKHETIAPVNYVIL